MAGGDPNRQPRTLADEERWFKRVCRGERGYVFTITTADGDFVGNCRLHHGDLSDRNAWLAIGIARPYWSQGYGSDAIRTLPRYQAHQLRVEANHVGVEEEGRLQIAYPVGDLLKSAFHNQTPF